MLKAISLALCLVIISYSSTGQKTFTLKKGISYRTTVNNTFEGFLANLTDTSLLISDKYAQFGSKTASKAVHYSDIDVFTLRKKGSGGRGALIGAGIGAVAGGIIYKKPAPGRTMIVDIGLGGSMLIGALAGAIPGLGIGALVGSAKTKFQPMKNKEHFQTIYKNLYMN